MTASTAAMANLPHPALRRSPVLLAALAAFVLAQLAAGQAWGQDTSRSLLERVERLQRELTTLQSYVYRGETPPAEAAAADSGPQAARSELRLSQLEQELRALTGQIEEQNFRIEQLAQRLDRLVADVDDRLLRLESGGAAATDPAADSGATADAAPGAAGESEVAANPSGAALPTGTAQEQYDHAFGLLSRTRYDEAAGAFGAFLEQHPEDALAGNAKYWLGETYYVQGQYADAAVTFAEGYQAYPESPKAPDNLLKLGKSLSALGQSEDACGTFDELIKRYGSASPSVISQAKAERKRLSCP